MSEPKPAGDEHMGRFVYCDQHLRPHCTGWCTVSARNKVTIDVETLDEAYAECRRRGLKIYGEP